MVTAAFVSNAKARRGTAKPAALAVNFTRASGRSFDDVTPAAAVRSAARHDSRACETRRLVAVPRRLNAVELESVASLAAPQLLPLPLTAA